MTNPPEEDNNPFLDEDDENDPEVILSHQLHQKESSQPIDENHWQENDFQGDPNDEDGQATPQIWAKESDGNSNPQEEDEKEIDPQKPLPQDELPPKVDSEQEEPSPDGVSQDATTPQEDSPPDEVPASDDEIEEFDVDEYDKLMDQVSHHSSAPEISPEEDNSTHPWDQKDNDSAPEPPEDEQPEDDEDPQAFDFEDKEPKSSRGGWRKILDQIKSEVNPDDEGDHKEDSPEDESDGGDDPKEGKQNPYSKLAGGISNILMKIKPLRRFGSAIKIISYALPILVVLFILIALFGGTSKSTASKKAKAPSATSTAQIHLPSGGQSTITNLSYNDKTDIITGTVTNSGQVILNAVPHFIGIKPVKNDSQCEGTEITIPIGSKLNFSVKCSVNYKNLKESFQWIQ
jgi:hypothetical protein